MVSSLLVSTHFSQLSWHLIYSQPILAKCTKSPVFVFKSFIFLKFQASPTHPPPPDIDFISPSPRQSLLTQLTYSQEHIPCSDFGFSFPSPCTPVSLCSSLVAPSFGKLMVHPKSLGKRWSSINNKRKLKSTLKGVLLNMCLMFAYK